MSAARADQERPSKGYRQFLTVRDLRSMPDEFARFAARLPHDRDFLSALQMCFAQPRAEHWSVLYHTLCSAAERYAIRRAEAEIRQEAEAAQELPLFVAGGDGPDTKRQ
ncbi:MAG TPA: hypothetical protein VFA75_10070 [Nevskia sp.]|nr:hypothetical protein [Nevskia sp.]